MTTAQFFEKFDVFAGAPDAVERMRELVLRLATSGQIAEQDSADEPAPELFKKIIAVRDHLIKRGAVKCQIAGNPILAGDTIDLPSSWCRCMISEVCNLQTGATPSRTEPRYFGGDIPWLVSGDINKGEIRECNGRITKEGLKNSNCKIIPENSVLIALNGQGKTRATVAVLRIPAALNQSLVAMTPYSGELLIPEYIFWNLRGRYYAIRDITGQDQRRGLNMKLVGQLSLPIPPLAEQKRIVAKVDELMALCDQLEVQQQERETKHIVLAQATLARFAAAPTPTNLNLLFHSSFSIQPSDLRKTILTLAVQGKLVPQDPNEQLPAIAANNEEAKDSEWASRLKLPESWRLSSLEPLLSVLKNGFNGKPSKVVGKFKVTRIETIARETIDLSRVGYAADLPEDVIAKHALKTGDILLSHINSEPHLGKTAICAVDDPTLIHGVNLLLLRPVEGIDSNYLNVALRELRSAGYFISIAQRAVNQASINQKNLGKAPIAVPPLAEQKRIVAKVEELMALVDALEAQQAAANQAATHLLDAAVSELAAAA